MVDYEYRNLFHAGSVEKHLYIQYGKETLDNENLASDTMELTECLGEGEELRFGCCCSSQFKITALNYGNCLVGQEISVWMELAGADQPFPLGRYTVCADQESTDGQYRNIVAYDALYGILKANMAEWYNGQTFPMTLREFRDAFFAYFDIDQEVATLINDAMIIEKTIDPSEISGKDVLTSICEVNGCFGRINRKGNFQYVVLEENMEGLYPADDLYPSDDLFPRDKTYTALDEAEYFTCVYEKFVSHRITKLQIRQEEHDVGVTVGEGDNGYVVEDNFLVYGKGTEELTAIADNLLAVVGIASYQPYTAEAVGDPCIEPGDCIRISVDGGWIESYVLKRVLKGIQMLDDTYSAPGKEYHSDNAGGMAKKIRQLKGKMNRIEHTIEMTRLEITDLEKGLTSRITQTADQIAAEVKRAQGQEVELAAAISVQAGQISSEVTRAQKAEQGLSDSIGNVNTILSSRITQTADQIAAEVKRAQGQEVELVAAINVQAGRISSEVTRAQEAEQGLSDSIGNVNTTLSSRITQTANQIAAEVKRAQGQEVELAAAISIQAGQISSEVTRAQEAEQGLSDSIGSVNTILSSRITQTADQIAAEVKRAQGQEVELAAAISIQANQINLKVAKGEVSSQLSVESDKIHIKSDRFSWDSTYSSLSSDGKLTAKNVDISGKITAGAGGTIGGFTIGDSSIYKNTNSMSSTANGVYFGTDGANWGGKTKITSDGKATFSDVELSGNGKLKFVQGANGTELNAKELTFGINSAFNVKISGEKVSCYYNYMDKDRIRAGSSTGRYTEMTSSELKAYDSVTQYIELHSYKAVTGGTYDFYEGSTGTLHLSKGWCHLQGNLATLGKSGGAISFFGTTSPSSIQKQVALISSPTSADTSTVATKLNELLNALKDYNLIK